MHIKYLAYNSYMTNLMVIYFSNTYFAITWKGEDTIGCLLVYLSEIIGSISPYCMFFKLAMFGTWQPHLFSDICQICVQCSLLNGWCQ